MTRRITSSLWNMRIPTVLVLSTGLVVGGLVLLYPGTITILGAELTWHISLLLILASIAMLIRDYKLQWSYIFSPTKRIRHRMDCEYGNTEEGKAEEERIEEAVKRVVEGIGSFAFASPPVFLRGRSVIRVELAPKYAAWHWTLRDWMVGRLLDGLNRGLLPERLCKWIGGLLGWTWKD